MVTEKEIKQISRIIHGSDWSLLSLVEPSTNLQEPAFRSRFEDGVLLILDEVDSASNKKYGTDKQ